MFNMEEFGKRLKSLRIEKQYTQESLAEVLGISRDFVGRLERGKKGPSIEIVDILREALGVTADYLLFGDLSLVQKKEELLQKADELKELINHL